jgi:5-methylthioribose kinase
LAHNADFESIEDTALRGRLETQNLMIGTALILNRGTLQDVDAFLAIFHPPQKAPQ